MSTLLVAVTGFTASCSKTMVSRFSKQSPASIDLLTCVEDEATVAPSNSGLAAQPTNFCFSNKLELHIDPNKVQGGGPDGWGPVTSLQIANGVQKDELMSQADANIRPVLTRSDLGGTLDFYDPTSRGYFLKFSADDLLTGTLNGPNNSSSGDDLQRLTEFTIQAVLKVDALNTSVRIFESATWGLLGVTGVSGSLARPFFNAAAGTTSSTPVVYDGTLNIISANHRVGITTVYLNGTLVGAGGETQATAGKTNHFQVGGFQGLVGDILVWNQQLSEVERKQVECEIGYGKYRIALSHSCD